MNCALVSGVEVFFRLRLLQDPLDFLVGLSHALLRFEGLLACFEGLLLGSLELRILLCFQLLLTCLDLACMLGLELFLLLLLLLLSFLLFCFVLLFETKVFKGFQA